MCARLGSTASRPGWQIPVQPARKVRAPARCSSAAVWRCRCLGRRPGGHTEHDVLDRPGVEALVAHEHLVHQADDEVDRLDRVQRPVHLALAPGRSDRRTQIQTPLYFVKHGYLQATTRIPPTVSPVRSRLVRARLRRDADGNVLIPHLVGRAINSITLHEKHDTRHVGGRDPRWPAWLRLVLSVARRIVAGRVSLGVELDLRNHLYGRLQQLELSFFDRQQTGQLMSRATVDLQSVRFFLGYGLIFIAQSLLTIVLAGIAMFLLQPGLAALALAPVPFVVVIAQPLRQALAAGDAGGPAADRRAHRRRGGEHRRRPRRQGLRPGGTAARLASATRSSASSTSRCSPPGFRPGLRADDLLPPNLGLALILLVGGREVIHHTPHPWRVHRVLRLPADAHLADADARLHARRRPAGHRIGRADLPGARPCSPDHQPRGRSRPARRPRSGRARRDVLPA